jgi:hypothetical protein
MDSRHHALGRTAADEVFKPVLARQLLAAITKARAERLSKPQFGSTTRAVNKPTGDNARKGVVKKRSELKTKLQGEES